MQAAYIEIESDIMKTVKTNAASCLKRAWMKMPDECFEAVTFGELPLRQQFIALPEPGDNHGHGGFLGEHHIFLKFKSDVAKDDYGLPHSMPHGQAMRCADSSMVDFHNSTPVLLLR